MNSKDLKENLYWLFIEALFKAKKGFIKIAEQNDLTFVQLFALCSMEPGEPVAMKDIANLLNCDASNVTGIIDRLFSHNYIERVERPSDRRIKMALLTKSGETLRENLIKDIVEFEPEIFNNLDLSEQDNLKTALVKLLG